MKREDIRKHIEGITDEQLDWLMTENGRDIEKYKSQVTTLNGQLSDVQTKLSAFDGVDVKDLQAQITKLTDDLKTQKDASDFDYALDMEITNRKGKNVKAIRSMLNLEELKKSEDLSTSISKALDQCVKDNSWAFGDAEGSIHVDFGGEHGNGGSADYTGFEKAFYELNPHLKQ